MAICGKCKCVHLECIEGDEATWCKKCRVTTYPEHYTKEEQVGNYGEQIPARMDISEYKLKEGVHYFVREITQVKFNRGA